MIKKRTKKLRNLPPHSWEPHPLANHGEINKTLLISILAFFLIILLALITLLATQFVGEAISTQWGGTNQGDAGSFLDSNTITVGDAFKFPVMVNFGDLESTAIEFFIDYNPDLLELVDENTCGDVTSVLDYNFNNAYTLREVNCGTPGELQFSYAGLLCDEDDCPEPLTGEQTVAEINFNAKSVGTVELIFESFQAYTLSNQPIDLIDNFDEPTEIIIEAIVEPTEQPSAPSGGGGSGGCRPKWEKVSETLCNASKQKVVTEKDTKCRKGTREVVEGCEGCRESWICSVWTDCKNGKQTRKCVDEHFCGSITVKPALTKSCVAEATGPLPNRVTTGPLPTPVIQQPTISFWGKYWVYLLSIIILIILIVLVIVLYYHYHRKQESYTIEDLKDWIDAERASGTSEEDIREIIKQHTTWKDEEVNRVM